MLRRILMMVLMCSTVFMATEAFAQFGHHHGGGYCAPQYRYYTPQYNYGYGGMGLGFSLGGGNSRVYIGAQPYYQPRWVYQNQWRQDAWGRWYIVSVPVQVW